MDQLTKAVGEAVKAAPCSLRALAREAGVPHVTLVWILSGKRNATPAVAAKVATALQAWSERCGRAAERLERATRGK